MRPSHILRAALVLLLVVAGTTAASAQTELDGQTSGGAFYRIVVPDGWTPANGLVIYNHGFSLAPIAPGPDLGPLADLQLSEGYAVAASSYSLTGWAVFETHLDNQQMYEAFVAAYGIPDQVLIYGASLGGLVTARDIEAGLIPNVVGAMPICGVLAGSRQWDGGIDLRLLYDALCSEVPGAAIPGGANGLPFPANFGENDLGIALNACFGIPGTPSAEQAGRLAQLLAVTGLPVEFIGTDMGFSTFGLADLVYDPRKLGGGQAFDNTDVDYGNAAINQAIARIQSDPALRQRMVDNYTPHGKVGDVKIVSIHTDKDGLVLVENQNEYASIVPAANLTTGILVEDTPSHCGFTTAETVAAWESLRGWVAGLPQPTAQDLQNTCDGLVVGGLAEGPCRYDPGFVVPDIDGRVRLRSVCEPDNRTLCLGEGGRFKVQIDWTDFSGNTGDGIVAGLATEDTGSFWFFDPANIEMVVKALDGRQNNGRLWIFYGSLTNVEFEMTVTDTETGLVRTYTNPAGNFASVGDTVAF
ncbi:MAG: hypothetical protein AAF560_06150 [Acidobacteriota bacterium]